MRLFKVRYWDYSNQHFQYKGHICLSSSIVWGFFSVMMVYVVQPQVERFVFWLNSEFVSVMTFLITVCMVYDFAGAFRKAMDLRKLLDQAEQILQELEQRAAEKKRLLEATATFAKATVTENIAEKKEALAQKVQSLDLESVRLEKLQQQLKNRMAENAEWFLTHNPGSRFYDCQGRDRLRRDPGSDQEASAGSFEREEEPTVSRFSQKFHILFVDFVRTLTYNR